MNKIVISSFSKGEMNSITQLNGHLTEVTCLLFYKNSDTLISSGRAHDHHIILWVSLGNNNWVEKTRKSNNQSITDMDFNNNTNLLFVGCYKDRINIYFIDQNTLII